MNLCNIIIVQEEIAREIADYTAGCLSSNDLAVKVELTQVVWLYSSYGYMLQIITFDYGMEEKNPIDHVRFYAKDRPNQAFRLKKDQV